MKTFMSRAATTTAFALVTSGATVISTGGGSSPVVLKVDGRANTNVSVAARDQFISVVWAASAQGGATDIYAAVSLNGGATFSRPVRVNDTPGDAHVSGEQPPRVVLVPRVHGVPSIVVVWTSSRIGGTRLLSARSDDEARTFGRAAVIRGTGAAGNRGWQSMVVDATGHVDVTWLDHREMTHTAKAAGDHHEHGAADRTTHDGVAMAQKSRLFVASLDSGIAPHSVTNGVCYCCKTAIASGSDGTLYLAWRHVYPGNVRDIAFTRSGDGGRTFAAPIRISDDHWVLDGCPENGPALAVDPNGRVHIVWITLLPASAADSEPTLGLFYAGSRDGRQFTPRQRIPTRNVPRHPQIAIDGRGNVLLAWDEQANGTRHVAIGQAVLDADAKIRFERDVLTDAAPAVYPALAPLSNGIIVAWTSGPSASSEIKVMRLSK